MTDRRSFLTAALIAPVVITAPAVAQTFSCGLDPVDRYWAATDAVNANRLGEDAYVQAINDLDRWEPPTPRDFLRKFIAQYHDGGCPTEDDRIAMITQAERLLS
ncbi:hypothetical protein [Sphingobium yanoikuyae]|uniref:hypothetical protein n=1 Tax=Sphingobium yanoikuyae TaxID=13690 RepID=UPI000262C2DF|nr:hypothetical protein [Sphingobium yanoikuyae]